MAGYTEFAGFYDQIMGDRSDDVERIAGYLDRHRPGATSLLELGSGTGAVLAGLAGRLAVTGVDLAPEMLEIAARNVPSAHLVQADMTKISLGTRFDAVICIFDTLNHLADFASWLELFDRVHEHLADGGLFAFDVNTTGRLRRLWRGHGFAVDFGPNTVIMDVRPAGPADLSIWTVRIFEHLHDDRYRSHIERIPELAVPLDQIRAALAGNFELLEQAALDGSPVSDESDRVLFAYRRR